MATLIVIAGATSHKADRYPPVMPLGLLVGGCGVAIMFAVWLVVRRFAWGAAATIAVLALLNILLLGLVDDDGAQQQVLTEFGWAQLVAAGTVALSHHFDRSPQILQRTSRRVGSTGRWGPSI